MRQNNPLIAQGSAGGQNVAGYVGEITYFADDILRKNHVWADGAPIDAARWPELAAHAAGAGWAQDGAGQYLTPDLRGRFLLGAGEGHAVGGTGGSETVALAVDEMPAHLHSMPTMAYLGQIVPDGNHTYQLSGAGTQQLNTLESGGSQPHNNMPPYYAAAAQIRAKADIIYAKAVIACPYEVGDILQTRSAVPPCERWPGTEWAAVETFLLGASARHAAGSTGGSETVALAVNQLPGHSHTLAQAESGGNVAFPAYTAYGVSVKNAVINSYDASTTKTGGGQPHSNMPPYTAVHIWERTA